ncbi:hypothetical protein CEXT_196351 [Caerostris extrusa]|uniref:Uncharacterized protein n=1 Tax=Caerostris extrusa TaxID=172846 RepID=A0AAV4MB58_CAEEX|nr:hypothetical protein CEXT_196351 [Caerostris extrusa]
MLFKTDRIFKCGSRQDIYSEEAKGRVFLQMWFKAAFFQMRLKTGFTGNMDQNRLIRIMWFKIDLSFRKRPKIFFKCDQEQSCAKLKGGIPLIKTHIL